MRLIESDENLDFNRDVSCCSYGTQRPSCQLTLLKQRQLRACLLTSLSRDSFLF